MDDPRVLDCVRDEPDGGEHHHQDLRRNGGPKKHKEHKQKRTRAVISWYVLFFVS